MTLALVIPVHNDAPALDRLLAQAERLGLFDQVIVVDDGSDQPVVTRRPGVEIHRLPASRGAGVARNLGLAQVRCDHMMFFDSDDSLTDELPALWRDLQTQAFDFCLFRHNDSRVSGLGGRGQMPLDNALWRAAGGHGALFGVEDTARAALVQTANYPWNKIYRTAFMRAADLRCSQTRLHNDILLHWQSFACADTILASDRIAAHHEIRPGGARLTNEASTRRLQVFTPLRETDAVLRAGDDRLRPAFLRFTAGLLDWVRSILDPALWPDLDRETGAFWRAVLDGDVFDRISRDDPVLALRLSLQMAGGRVPC